MITRRDKRGWTIDRIESTRTTGSGRLSPSDTFEQTDWTRWTHHELDGNGRTLATRVYHTIPASELGARAGAGEVGMHYDRTSYGYDPRTGLRVREVSPGGSITRTLRDPLGRPVAVWAGTDDRSRNGKGWQDWSPDNNGGDMVLVSERGYDDSRPLEERAVARTIEHVDAFTERITDHHYDFHYRRISTESEEGAYDERHYDNLDRVVLCEHYDGRGGNTLLEIASHRYDGRGRLEQTRAWSIDPAAGAVVRDEANHRRYDPAGRLIALVRSDESYVRHTYGGAEDPVETVRGRSSAGDALLLERTHTRYNAAGQVLLVSHERRPEPGRPLRVHHTAWWYDGAGRRIATARAETGEGDPSFIRPSTPPADSSRMQVATTRYNRAGEIEWEAEAAEETRSRYDHAGRLIRRTRHRSGGREDTSYAYTSDGRIESIRTHGPDGRRFTRYVYGVTLADSEFASSELMRAVERSDGRGGFERETFAYNAQGELVRRRDPKGHLHHYRYDRLGRLVGHSAGDDAVRTEAEHGASDRPSFSKSISSHFNGT